MSWESILGLNEECIINNEVDSYLKEKGFFKNNFRAIFYTNEWEEKNLKHIDAECYTLTEQKDLNQINININKHEILIEQYTKEESVNHAYKDLQGITLTVETLDELLNNLAKELVSK